MTHTLLRIVALPAALVAALALASCGTSSNAVHDTASAKGMMNTSQTATGAPATGAKNAADVQFATMMIPHHAQAIAMADIALRQATDAKVKALAPKIKSAQGPQIVRMSGWLTGWGEPAPRSSSASDMSGMAGMGDQTGGMMSAQEMTGLGKATGSAFDRMWLQDMVRHHQGAVSMARTELAQGANPEAKQLASSIIDSQSAEVATMNTMLTGVAR